MFDEGNSSPSVVLSAGFREAQGNQYDGAFQPVIGTTVRSDRRFAEFVILEPGTVGYDKRFMIGIAGTSYRATRYLPFPFPADMAMVELDGWNFAVGEAATADVTWSDGGNPGELKIYSKGVLTHTVQHMLTEGKLMFAPTRDTKVRLNTGQEALSYAPAGSTRWN